MLNILLSFSITNYKMLTKTCYKVQNKFKNYRLRWLFKPLRLAKFESLWIQVCSIVAVWDTEKCLSLSFSTFLSSDRVFFYDSIMIPLAFQCWLPSLFYSVIPRALGLIDSPPLLPWVSKPVMCLSPRRLILSLFLIISSFWCCFFESPWLTFHSKVCLRGSSWFLIFPSFSPFQTQLLVVLSLCHFSQVGRIHSCWVKGFPYYFPL